MLKISLIFLYAFIVFFLCFTHLVDNREGNTINIIALPQIPYHGNQRDYYCSKQNKIRYKHYLTRQHYFSYSHTHFKSYINSNIVY